MIPSVSPTPEVKCYSFDTIEGRPHEPSGALWRPFNPNYDPGPPPPPREPRAPRPPRPSQLPTTSNLVARGADNVPPLPAPQSTLIPHNNVLNNRGRGGFRGNHQRPPRYGGNQPRRFGTANHPETRPIQLNYGHDTEEEKRPSSSVVTTQESSREVSHS